VVIGKQLRRRARQSFPADLVIEELGCAVVVNLSAMKENENFAM
jgi:hypothetical protein